MSDVVDGGCHEHFCESCAEWRLWCRGRLGIRACEAYSPLILGTRQPGCQVFLSGVRPYLPYPTLECTAPI